MAAVPSTLSALARPPATGGDRKNDAKDARHVAQVALFRHDLRPVVPEDQNTIMRLLTERRDDRVHERTRVLNRLHAVLCDLLPGGAPTGLSADKAAALTKGVRPVTATDNCRRDIARDLPADLRRLDRQVKDDEARMREAVAATRTTLTTQAGLGTVLAAKVLGHIGDVGRFPTEQHFAGYTGSAPPGRLQRQQRPPPARHRWQPRAELGAAHDRRLPDPRRRARAGVPPPQDQ
ncbi:IS110 family transposase [Streptomyces olivaceus]|uniref:IS110 family transposase n=1 Tax=Streptomyces olivaceus TaxID=47716 RepID=UPI003F4CE021